MGALEIVPLEYEYQFFSEELKFRWDSPPEIFGDVKEVD